MNRLLTSTSVAALLIAAPAFAQTVTTPPTLPGSPNGSLQSNANGQFSGAVPTVTNGGMALTTSQAQASGGSTSIPFASLTGIGKGDALVGTSIPNADVVVAFNGSAQHVQAANGSFSSGQKVIPLSSTTGYAVGMQCTDVTGSGVIGAGNLIASVQGGVSITLTSNTLTSSVGATDSIQCDPVAVMQTTTSAAVAAAAAVYDYPGATSFSTPGQALFLGGIYSSAASVIANLWFIQASGGGHNWGIGGPGNTYGSGTTSYSLYGIGTDTSAKIDLYPSQSAGRSIELTAALAGVDNLIYCVVDSRCVFGANNVGVFEISAGSSSPTGTGNFARIICCHEVSNSSYAGGSNGGAISPKTGSTVTMADGTNTYNGLYLTPAGTLATLTISLQPTPGDGMEFTVLSTQVITALTWVAGVPSGGSAVALGSGLPAALAAYVPVKIKCINASGSPAFTCASTSGGTWIPWQ